MATPKSKVPKPALIGSFLAETFHPVTEEKKQVDNSIGLKYDSDKPDMSLLSSYAVTEVAKVLSFGKVKYAAHNWRNGISTSRLLAATLRHMFSYLSGETLDPETGLSHIAHAMCCCMFILELKQTRPELDDRHVVSIPK